MTNNVSDCCLLLSNGEAVSVRQLRINEFECWWNTWTTRLAPLFTGQALDDSTRLIDELGDWLKYLVCLCTETSTDDFDALPASDQHKLIEAAYKINGFWPQWEAHNV